MADNEETPTDTTIAYLHTPKTTPMTNWLPPAGQGFRRFGETLSLDEREQLLAIFKDERIDNYGQLIKFLTEDGCIAYAPGMDGDLENYFRLRRYLEREGIDLPPEITNPDSAKTFTEAIYRLVITTELENKWALERKYHEAQEEIVRLKEQQPVQQLDKAATEGREIAKSM